MKRRKPCQHYRRIKTRKGVKVVVVNKGRIRKRKSYGFMELKKTRQEVLKAYRITPSDLKKIEKKSTGALTEREFEIRVALGDYSSYPFDYLFKRKRRV